MTNQEQILAEAIQKFPKGTKVKSLDKTSGIVVGEPFKHGFFNIICIPCQPLFDKNIMLNFSMYDGNTQRWGEKLSEFSNPTLKTAQSIRVTEWNEYCTKFGFKPEHLGAEFEDNGKVWVIYAIKKWAESKPVIAHVKDNPNERFVFHKDIVKKLK